MRGLAKEEISKKLGIDLEEFLEHPPSAYTKVVDAKTRAKKVSKKE